MSNQQYPDLVSIIIPVYNTGSYLKETLESCLKQTYTNVEVLAIDDNSNDKETLEILQSFAQQDSRIKVIRSDENHGVTYGRNLGVELCQGKYFAFLDHDDVLAADFVERLRQAILDYQADMAECSFQSFMDTEQEGQESDDYRLAYVKSNAEGFASRQNDVVVFNRQDVIKSGYIFKLTKLCWAKLFVTETYRKAKLRFEDVRYGEDIDWSIRVFTSLERFVSVRFQGLHYRLHKGAGSSGSIAFFKGINESWRRVYDLVCQRDELKHLRGIFLNEFKSYKFYAYKLLCECTSGVEQREELRYLLDLYRYCGWDLEWGLRAHGVDLSAAQIWYPFYMALQSKVTLPKTLVVSFTSLFDPEAVELSYIVQLLHQLGLQGMSVQVLTTDLSARGQQVKFTACTEQGTAGGYTEQGLTEQKQNEFVPKSSCKIERTVSTDFAESGYTKGKDFQSFICGCMQCYVLELATEHTCKGGQLNVGAEQYQRFLEALSKQLARGKFENIVLVGRNPFMDYLGQSLDSKLRKLSWVLEQDLSAEEIASGKVRDTAWAMSTLSFFKQGGVIPSYAQLPVDFKQREYVTLLSPDCEHGLAVMVKLIAMFKQRNPQQKFILVQAAHDNVVGQLQGLHSKEGQKLFALGLDLSNLKISTYPQDFAALWAETKVLVQLSPIKPNHPSLALEALYNAVPVLTTSQQGWTSVGTLKCAVAQDLQQDISCLPPESDMYELVSALERVLSWSEEEIQASCAQLILEYQQQEHLAAWLAACQA